VLPLAVALVAGFGVAAQAASSVVHTTMPTIVPSTATPDVTDGEVETIVKIGNKVIIGGTFTSAAEHGSDVTVPRANIMAFDATTGVIDNSFVPSVNGEVTALLPGIAPDTVYIAGYFNTVNGVTRQKVALLNTIDGSLVTGFKVAGTSAAVNDLALVGNRLYLGGIFTEVGNVAHVGLATVDATTGKLDPYMNIQLQGHHNWNGTGAKAATGVERFDTSPDGTKLVVVGNFKTVDGTDHDQAVMIDISTPDNATIANWQTNRYDDACARNAFDDWVRDVAFSPDGSYFVIVGTGAGFSGTLCDAAARWETNTTGSLLRETWVDYTGGDTLLSVAITGDAVYVGGHQRWMNNSLGRDSLRAGAVARPGLAALDPVSGMPLKWNAGRNSRGNGARALYATDDGLYVGSDTDYIGNFQYTRKKIAFFPLVGGYTPMNTNVAGLPANVYFPKTGVAQTPVLFRINVGGALVPANDGGIDWADDTATNSPYRLTGGGTTIVNFANQITATDPALPIDAPLDLFNSQRRDQASTPDMQWNFPAQVGVHLKVKLFFAERQWPAPAIGARVFNITIDNVLVADHLDITAENGWNVATDREYLVTSDGNVDIDFSAVAGLPMLSAIEIDNLDNTPQVGIGKRSYDGVTAGPAVDAGAADGTVWTNARGAFWVGNKLFYAMNDNNTYVRTFDGTDFGAQLLLNPYSDPTWDGVPTGSGTTTYDGLKSSFYSEIPSLRAMWYQNGRLFYAISGQQSLFWRWFSPDSGVIGADRFTVSGSSGFNSVAGTLFASGGYLYFSKTDGKLYRIAWNGLQTSGSSVAVSGPGIDAATWNGSMAFLAP
jgi:hypothetical protein